MLQAPASATVVDVSVTGPKRVGWDGPKVCQQTEAGSILRTAPHLLVPEQEITSKVQQNEDWSFMDGLVEVNEQLENSEYDNSCVHSGPEQVKGKFKKKHWILA